jgi:hypothetical protein
LLAQQSSRVDELRQAKYESSCLRTPAEHCRSESCRRGCRNDRQRRHRRG